MNIDDVYKSLGKSLLDEFEDDLSTFLGRAMNHYLSTVNAAGSNIDIIEVIKSYLDHKLFYVDIGDVPRERAEEVVSKIVKNFKEEEQFKTNLKKSVDRISTQEERRPFLSTTPFFPSVLQPSSADGSEVSTIEPKYDIHDILKNNYKIDDESVRKFVEKNWYSTERLDNDFYNLPKLGDDNDIIPVNSDQNVTTTVAETSQIDG